MLAAANACLQPAVAGRYWPVRRPVTPVATGSHTALLTPLTPMSDDDIKTSLCPPSFIKPATGTAGRLLCQTRLYPAEEAVHVQRSNAQFAADPTGYHILRNPMNWRQMANLPTWDITPHLCQIRCPPRYYGENDQAN